MPGAIDSRFRPFKVVLKVRESATITSFHLAPVEPKSWRPFDAGQFLTILVPEAGEGQTVRNYTVSSPPRKKGIYRITVKREGASSSGLPEGLASCWLHDCIEPGSVVNIDTPRGAFKLDMESRRPVLLLSGGVGLTPTVSMLSVLAAESDRSVWFVHSCDSAEVHALRSEVNRLAASRPGIDVHYCYRFAEPGDLEEGRCHSTGLITREMIQSLLPLDDYDVYMCGPPPFMRAMYDTLLSLGVRKARISYEFFGSASLLSEPDQKAAQPFQVEEGGICIVLEKSGRSFAWKDGGESLLAFLEEQGVEPEFSCRAGVCGTCEHELIAGDVHYFEEPLDELPANRVLLCCTRPKTSIVLDL